MRSRAARRRTLVRALSVAVALVAVSVMAACSSPVSDSPATAAPTSTPVTPSPSVTPIPDTGGSAVATPVVTAAPSPAATPVTPPASVGGGVLRFSVPEAGPHFDIHREVSPSVSTWGIGLIYSRLFRNTIGDSGDLVECELCESWTFVDAEKLRIKLRPDVTWQRMAPLSGRPLVASDVVFSLERQRAPGSPNGDLLTGIGEITAIDDLTIELEVAGLDADLFLNLADGRTRIVAPEAVAVNGDLLRGPNVGSGPWIWVGTTAQTAAYDRNPDYFEPGRPGLDGLQISFIPDPGTRIAAFRSGLMDIADAPAGDVDRALRQFPGVTLNSVMFSGTGAEIAFNTAVAPFDSRLFRQAVFRAMDPWSDLEDVWDGNGAVTLGIPSPRTSWLLSEDAMRTAFADVQRAIELASESGVQPTGPVEITVGQFGDAYLLQALRVADALATLGFDSVIREVTTRDFADRVWIGGDYQVFVGAQAPVDGVNGDLFSVQHSGGLWNTTGFASAELDALIELQSTQLDPAERRRTLLDAQFRILEGAHRFTVSARVTNWLARAWVEDFDPDPRRGETAWLARITFGERTES